MYINSSLKRKLRAYKIISAEITLIKTLTKRGYNMNKKLKNILEWIVGGAIVIAIAYGTPIALTKILNTEYPIASITSSSMWPALKKGDIVFIKGVDKSELEAGDIIVYRNEKGFTIHRITELNEETLKTRGDANSISDKPIRYEEVVGRAVEWNGKPFRIPKLGKISIWKSDSR